MRFVLGTSTLDLDRASVETPTGAASLTPNEVKVLRVLAERRGRGVDRDLLLRALGYAPSVVTRAVDQVVFRLRRKLEPDPENPRFLVSEPNSGYRLTLPQVETPIGRSAELARLKGLVAQHGVVWLAGLPGSGRRTLAAAAGVPAGPAEGPAPFVVLTDAPPLGAPLVRLGPLPTDVAMSLLETWVVDGRGGAPLDAGERSLLEPVALAADCLPGPLRAVAAAAVFRPLHPAHLPVDPAVAERLSLSPLREVLAVCVVFPDPFLPSEAVALGADEADLQAAWRGGWLERTGDRLRVPAAVRRAGLEGDRARALATWLPAVLPLAEATIERGGEDDVEALFAWEPRLRTGTGPDAAWLPVHCAFLGEGRTLGPRADHGGAWGALADALDHRRLGHIAECQAAASRSLAAPDAHGLWPGAIAAAVRLAANLGASFRHATLEALEARSPTPLVQGSRALLRGHEALLARSDVEGARREFLVAFAAFRSLRNLRMQRTTAELLSACAAREGRVREAMAWIDTGPAERRSVDRWRRVVYLVALEELTAAEAELSALESAGESLRLATHVRAGLTLLAGNAPKAAAEVLAAGHLPILEVDRMISCRREIAVFVAIALGESTRAADALAEPETTTVTGPAPTLTRVCVLAAAGDVEGAAAALEGVEGSSGWIGHAVELARAYVSWARGEVPDLDGLRARYLGSPFREPWIGFASAALRLRLRHPRSR